jgi:hypothetical protein
MQTGMAPDQKKQRLKYHCMTRKIKRETILVKSSALTAITGKARVNRLVSRPRRMVSCKQFLFFFLICMERVNHHASARRKQALYQAGKKLDLLRLGKLRLCPNIMAVIFQLLAAWRATSEPNGG